MSAGRPAAARSAENPPGCLTFDRGEGEGAPVRAGRTDLGSRGGEVGGARTPGRGCLALDRAVGRGGESSGAVLRLMGRGRMGLGRGRKGTVRICEVFCMRVDTVYRSQCFLETGLVFRCRPCLFVEGIDGCF